MAKFCIEKQEKTVKKVGRIGSPKVDFTNILHADFTHTHNPNSAKQTDVLTVFFALFGSTHVKAARKMLVKLTPRFNFT
jgi:hypothetical protein